MNPEMDSETFRVVGVGAGVVLVLSVLRKAGRRIVPYDPAESLGADPNAHLCERGWFFREFVVTIAGYRHRVRYDGGGAGERVLVDGHPVAQGTGLVSLVPRLEFPIGGHRGLIEVDVRWALVIKGFQLSLDDAVIYSEGTFSI